MSHSRPLQPTSEGGAAELQRWAYQMKRLLDNICERIKGMRQGRKNRVYEIACTPEGLALKWLTMENETGSQGFAWNAVSVITEVKRDL